MWNDRSSGYVGDMEMESEKTGLATMEYKVRAFTSTNEFENLRKEERTRSFIKGFAEKKLNQKYKKNTEIQDFSYEFDEDTLTLRLTGQDGIRSIHGGMQAFVSDLDVSLYYLLMDLGTLRQHLILLQGAVREQHQWHWLGEERNYDDLIIKN